MGYVFMKDVPQAQTVGADGRSMYPPSAVHMPETVDETGRYQEVSGSRDEIPNPAAATDGQVVKAANGLWGIGADEAGSGSGSGSGSSGSSGVMVLHIDLETSALDKTWQEIYDALMDDTVVFVSYLKVAVVAASDNGDSEFVVALAPLLTTVPGGDFAILQFEFSTDTANDYPVMVEEPQVTLIGSGSGSGDSDTMIVHMNTETGALDKTMGEIKAALEATKMVTILYPDPFSENGVTGVGAVSLDVYSYQDYGLDYASFQVPSRYGLDAFLRGTTLSFFWASDLDDYPIHEDFFSPDDDADK